MIKEISLTEIDINDTFFDSLRGDYYKFNEWFKRKQMENLKAYAEYKSDKLAALCILKIENEYENYDTFDKPFMPLKRLKISTLKVIDEGKRIGQTLIDKALTYAKEQDAKEIYITIYPKYTKLINLLTKNGFSFYTFKTTLNSTNEQVKECVYIKKL